MRISKSAIGLAVTAALSTLTLVDSTDSAAAPRLPSQKPSSPSHGAARFKYPVHSRAPADGVLYDQTGVPDGIAPAQNYQSAYDAYDAEAADDFVVADATGWTVSGFNFQVEFWFGSPAPDATYDIHVYNDTNGLPGSNACDYQSQPGVLDAGETNLSVALPAPCLLSAGRYWVSLIGNVDYPPQLMWKAGQGAAIDNIGAWREPLDGDATGCTSWTTMSNCITGGGAGSAVGSGESNLLFQVIGSVGANTGCGPNEICLVSTVGTDLSPSACGAADAIDATVGDQLNFCYTITNNTGIELDYQSLANNVDGALFTLMNHPLLPGDTFQYNHIATVSTTNTYNSTWTAQDVPPGYTPEVTGGGSCADRIFADGLGDAPTPCASFIDVSGTGTPLGLSDDASADVTMPFSFNFFGTTSNLLSVSNNGGIVFGASGAILSFGNLSLPAASISGPAILPLWDDFDSSSGDVYTDVRGSAPNREFVVEWYRRAHYAGNTDPATFEVIFNEADGTLQFEYADVAYTAVNNASSDPDVCDGGVCATIGLQGSPTLYDQFSAFQAAVTDGSGIKWTPTTPQVFTSTDSVAVNVGAPQIVVNPSPITGVVVPGGSTVIPFVIENQGDRDLDWSLTEAGPANLHFPPAGSRYAMPMGDPSRTSSRSLPPSLRGPRAKSFQPPSFPDQSNSTVPVFAADIYNNQFVTFDALTPGTVNVAASTDGTPWTGGAFIDGDFSKLYVIAGSFGANPDQFATIDTATGAKTVIGTANSGGLGWNGMAYDSTTGTMYAVAGCPSGSQLYTIDINTGAPTPVGNMTNERCSITIAIDSAGQMYSIDIVNDALYAVDKTNANDSLIGSIGFNANYAQDMTFDLSTDILYYAAFNLDLLSDVMYTVDTGMGTTNLIGPIAGGAAEIDGMGIETVAGPCSQPQDLPWLTLNPLVGTTPPLGSTPIDAAIDATNANDGDVLVGTVCATSNDPAHHVLGTPITVTVAAAPPIPPTVTKIFAPAMIASGASSTLTITLANAEANPATLSAPLTDAFPPGLVVAAVPNASTTCGGNVAAAEGADSVVLDSAGSAIPGAGTCTISVDVTAAAGGTYLNDIPGGALQTSAGNNAAPADAALMVLDAPTLTKSFAPAQVADAGVASTLTITLANPNAVPAALTAPLLDSFPENLAVASTPNESTTCGGTVSAIAGNGEVTLDNVGAVIPATGTCTVSVDVVALALGTYANSIPAGSLQTDAGVNAASADATLIAGLPPTLDKAFAPATITVGNTSTLTITIGNPNAASIATTGPLTDALPGGMIVDAVPNVTTTCGGTVTALAGSVAVVLDSGAFIPPGGCTVSADVSVLAPGTYPNTIATDALQTNVGTNAAPANAILDVTP